MATGTWISTATSGNWNLATTAPWSGGIVAADATYTANFSSNITAATTVTLTEARTIGNITFSDNGALGSAWTLAGASTLTLDNGGSQPVLTGATKFTISTPVSGTNGFIKNGAASGGNAPAINSASTGLSGVVRITEGELASGTNTVPMTAQSMPNVSEWIIASGCSRYVWNSNVVQSTVIPKVSGAGIFWVGNNSFSTKTHSLVFDDITGLANLNWIYTASTNSNKGFISVKQFPTVPWSLGGYYTGIAASNVTNDVALTVATDATAVNTPAAITLAGDASGGAVISGASSPWIGTIYADQLTGAMEFSGNASRPSNSPTYSSATFQLAGTSGADNKFSGVISDQATRTIALAKAEAGRWILSGANTYRGATTISAGTLAVQSNTAFGGAGAVTQTGGTIEVTGGVALNKAGAALTLISAAGANALTSLTGSNTIACAGVTLSSTIIVDIASGADLTVNNTAAMSGAFGITKNNSGEFGLGTFANTYTGAVTVAAGTLTVGNLQNSGTASSLGTGAGTPAIALTGTLKYTGTGHSTNRSITFTGAAPALEASDGSGAVTYSACTTASVTAGGTITFKGNNTDANTMSGNLSDGAGTLNVSKSGVGKWVLGGATVNYTGTTTVSAGTLGFGNAARTLSGAVSISGGTIENGTSTLSANVTMTGGTLTAELTGNKTLDVNLGDSATLQPTNNANTYTGATTVATGGILRLITGENPTLGGGKVLGDSNVSVTGNLKTDASVTQKGQMRYGGNLTFNSGAKLYVGGA